MTTVAIRTDTNNVFIGLTERWEPYFFYLAKNIGETSIGTIWCCRVTHVFESQEFLRLRNVYQG